MTEKQGTPSHTSEPRRVSAHSSAEARTHQVDQPFALQSRRDYASLVRATKFTSDALESRNYDY